MSDYGKRMAANNDLMDPDWKPSFPKKETVGSLINDLIFASSTIHNALNTSVPLDLNFDYSVKMSARLWNDFLSAYEKLNTITNKTDAEKKES